MSIEEEREQAIKQATEDVVKAAEVFVYEYALEPTDEVRYRRSKNALYQAVRELQQCHGDEDLGGPTPPPEEWRPKHHRRVEPGR